MMGQLIHMQPLQIGERVALADGMVGHIEHFSLDCTRAQVSYQCFPEGTHKPGHQRRDMIPVVALSQFGTRPCLRLAARNGVIIAPAPVEPDPISESGKLLAAALAGEIDPDDAATIDKMEALTQRLRSIAFTLESPDGPGAA